MSRTIRRWLAIVGPVAGGMALIDLWLLQRKSGFVSAGFLTETHLRGPLDTAGFLLAGTICNAAVCGPLVTLALTAARRMRLSHAAAALMAFVTAATPLAVLDFVNYQLWSYLGDAFDFSLLFNLTGRHLSEIVAVAAQSAVVPALGLTGGAGVLALSVWVVQRRTRHIGTPVDGERPAGLTRAAAVSFLAGVVILVASAIAVARYDFGLRRTAAGRSLGYLIDRATDVDGDGYGLLRAPRDPAPFDASIHPYAIDVPGNGIDEDGIAGDLPIAAAAYRELPPPAGAWLRRPSVVFITLESVRADAVGAVLDGKPVTPVLDGLARTGVSVPQAFSHNGYTVQSRFHMLSGSLAGLRDDTTLIDDFHDRGYQTAYFSAQDESFGAGLIDYHNVDVFYDARQDRNRRFTLFTTPGSLAVPASVLETRLQSFLAHRGSDRPLFLYINLQDTHFPYHHAGMPALSSAVVVPPSEIAPARAADVRKMYLNSVSNVDAAIGRLIAGVRRVVPNPGVIVISDHGESLFDEGFLGHGYALNDAQTRIPLIVSGLPLRIRQPFGEVDLRDEIDAALRTWLPGTDGTPVLAGTDGRVFQYLGTFDRPAEIGWKTAGGRQIYDFRTNRFDPGSTWQRVSSLSATDQAAFADLVHYWEAARWASAHAAHARPVE